MDHSLELGDPEGQNSEVKQVCGVGHKHVTRFQNLQKHQNVCFAQNANHPYNQFFISASELLWFSDRATVHESGSGQVGASSLGVMWQRGLSNQTLKEDESAHGLEADLEQCESLVHVVLLRVGCGVLHALAYASERRPVVPLPGLIH